jgi:thiol-disulfide isomerase/thioredoxin
MHVSSKFTARRPSAFLCVALTLSACGGEDSPPSADESKEAVAKSEAEGDKAVPYDLRQIRPGEKKLADVFEASRKGALAEGKQVAVLFSADWCAPCKRLEAELGNTQPRSQIGEVRIVMVKEEDWRDSTRMVEFDNLRLRWSPAVGAFPLFVLLNEDGSAREEMKEAIERLESQGLEPTVANWFAHGKNASG